MLYEEHAMNEIDNSKIATKSTVNMTKTLRMNPRILGIVPDI